MLSLFKKSLSKLMVYSEDKLKKSMNKKNKEFNPSLSRKRERRKGLGYMNLVNWYRDLMYYSNQLLHRSNSTLTSLLQK